MDWVKRTIIDYRGFLMSLQPILKIWRAVRQLGIVDGYSQGYQEFGYNPKVNPKLIRFTDLNVLNIAIINAWITIIHTNEYQILWILWINDYAVPYFNPCFVWDLKINRGLVRRSIEAFSEKFPFPNPGLHRGAGHIPWLRPWVVTFITDQTLTMDGPY